MSWYEEAANEVGAAILAKDGPIVGPREVAAIIAKHDPNKWVPVEWGTPPLDNFNGLTSKRRLVVRRGMKLPVFAYWNPRCGNWQGYPNSTDIVADVTHWREIVLPEVKG